MTLGFPLIANALCRSLEGPVEIVSAHGHGRSFRGWSSVLVRGLPGIRHCRLWDELAPRPAALSTWGLITDVGNDLIYGATPEELLPCVRHCLEQFQSSGAATLIVRPPTERLLQLSELRYRVTKKLLFPGPTLPWSVMKDRLTETDQRLEELGREFGAVCITPERAWYGIDPIHIHRGQRRSAWESILNSWPLETTIQVHAAGLAYGLRIWTRHPAERRLFWVHSHRTQPILTWESGSSLWLY